MEGKVQMTFIPAGRRRGFPPIFRVRGVEPVVLVMAGNGVEVRRVSYYIIVTKTLLVRLTLGSMCYRLAREE